MWLCWHMMMHIMNAALVHAYTCESHWSAGVGVDDAQRLSSKLYNMSYAYSSLHHIS